MTLSARLEGETERTRADFVHSAQELRSRLTLGQVVDEVWQEVRHVIGRDFTRNLGDQVAKNPMPATLVAAGVAWMMFAKANERTATASNGSSTNGNRAMNDTTDQTKSTIGDAAASTAKVVSDTASSIGKQASAAYHETTESVSQAASAVKTGAQSLYQRTGEYTRQGIGFCVDHPLVLAGAGLAIGAAIGALLPTSETENKLMGETSDEIKREAENLATEQLQKATAVGELVVDHLAEVASNEFMPKGPNVPANESMPANPGPETTG